ncbi:MAG TPA: alpha/beta hydrolase [Halanaerobiales bacterium]|nr:alpha/beta hydrolase [Halanaerobiales bacterium]
MKQKLTVEKREFGVWLDTDITYSQVPGWAGRTTRDLKLSIIRPSKDLDRLLPVIVWVCGGAWLSMDWNVHLAEFVTLAKQGYVIASVEYRTSNQACFPAQLEDVKAAIRYLRANSQKYQIDPERIGVMGESAGGHLAALIGTTGENREFDRGENLEQSSAVQAVCDWYGVVDLWELTIPGNGGNISNQAATIAYQLLGEGALENREISAKANPLSYISKKTPPFLILHGNQDQVVPLKQSEKLYKALQKQNITTEFYIIEGADHATAEFFQEETKEIIKDFFDQHL